MTGKSQNIKELVNRLRKSQFTLRIIGQPERIKTRGSHGPIRILESKSGSIL